MSTKLKSNQTKRIANPIRSNEDVNRIRSNLINNPRDLLLFDLAVQTGIGMKNLLVLKVSDLMGTEVGSNMPIKTETYERCNTLMNHIIFETFHKYLEKLRPDPDDYLFRSKKLNHPLNLSTVSNMINSWFERANIKNCRGASSLRKTWEYNQKDKIQAKQDITLSNLTSVSFKPIVTPKAQDIIYKDLINAIVSGKIPPGTKLTAIDIANAFNVSQAPVRVALNWLEARGFIISEKKTGSIVKKLSLEELNEILKVRLMLESEAARLSYKIRTEETLNLLKSLIKRWGKNHDFKERVKINRQFHLTLYRDANMPFLMNLISDLFNRLNPYVVLGHTPIGKDQHSDTQTDILLYNYNKLLEGMRDKNINQILEFLKIKIYRTSEDMKKLFGENGN